MSRWAVITLSGVATYGVAMAVSGVLLVAGGAVAQSGGGGGGAIAGSQPAAGPGAAAGSPDPSSGASEPSATSSPASPSPSVPSSSASPAVSAFPVKPSKARQATNAPGQVISFAPLEISLPNGSLAAVQPADVADDGALLIPDNPQVVGYWTGGAQPGEQFGSVVIAGHVDSARFGIGVLAGLKRVKPGQVIELRGGQHRLKYRITRSWRVTQQSLATDGRELFQQDGPPRLVVITCGGPFDPVRHHYRDNLIVEATPLA